MPTTTPWGKLDRNHPDAATAPRLSLIAHSIDVAAVVAGLLALPLWRSRLDALAGRPLTPIDLDRLTVLAFFHDVGKAGAGFYSQGLPAAVREDWFRRHRASPIQRGHTRIVAPLVGTNPDYRPHRDALGLEALLDWAGGDPVQEDFVVELWMAAVSHHGTPISATELANLADVFPTWLYPIDGYDPVDGLQSLAAAARALWPKAFNSDEVMAFGAGEAVIHAFAGLVSLADWIGSSTAPGFFPYDLGAAGITAGAGNVSPFLQGTDRWPVARERATAVLKRLRIDVTEARESVIGQPVDFAAVFENPPYLIQTEASDPDRASPVILESETGSGKTEAALWRFKRLFDAGRVDSLCFLLPTRISATSIEMRVRAFIETLFPDANVRPNVVLAVPSYLRANGHDGTRLAGFEVFWPDQPDEPSPYWAAENSKRYFAAAAAVATVDQFLLSALRTKHAHLRATTLLRALVVVDEVHASDPYMRALLRSALRRHHAAGGEALLMSATLTGEARDDFLEACHRKTWPRMARAPDEDRAAANDYPRISSPGQPPFIGTITADAVKIVRHRLAPLMTDAIAVADLAIEAASQGARVLIVRNTVRQALETQLALEQHLGLANPLLFRFAPDRGPTVVAMHHGRYATPDRRVLDHAVEAAYGKSALQQQRPGILCATQTLEISVDCDADFLITDLVPMDVLLQRLGRLHRHRLRDPWRPADFRLPRCVVLVPADRDLGPLTRPGRGRSLGIGPNSAYPDLLSLEATWRALESERFAELRIPTDNRALVEASCASSAHAALSQELGEDWAKHFQQMIGIRGAHAGHATAHSTDWHRPWSAAAPGELDGVLRTRLGLDGIELTLKTAWTSPFGQQIEHLTLPGWMLPASSASSGASGGALTHAQDQMCCLTATDSSEDALCFTVSDRCFRYDRLGLQRVDQAPE